VNISGVPSKVNAFAARGNYLNWLTSSKLDVQKQILTGGKYDTSSGKFISESRGCVGRRFLKEALSSGKRAVLIVHGRGLSSPEEPVLKTKVKEWLTSGRWRKWVMAFTSARACDGATGATYVLLRQRPATRRYRRQHPKKHGS